MPDERIDIRNPNPQDRHKAAFLAGWTRAVDGDLFATIHERKTHTNMGNLFGWVFGEKPREFRERIWELYREDAIDIEDE